MKIGMRNIKTAISVFICVSIYKVFNLDSPFYAAIAAVIAMQSSVRDSFKVGKNRMLGTFLGAVVGFLFALIAPQNPLLIGLGIIIIIYISNLLDWNSSISISGVVFIAIMINLKDKTPFQYSFFRLLDTFIGISIAVLVNYLIVPPGSTDKIISECRLLIEKNRSLIKESLCEGGLKEQNITKEIKTIKKSIIDSIEEVRPKKTESSILVAASRVTALCDDILNHLEVINTIEGELSLNSSNIKILSEVYGCVLEEKKEINNEINIVYNYHASNILRDIASLEKIMETLK